MTEPRKKPWLKWYPADWRSEPRLRLVSRAARSLWLDLIGLMHDAEPYGHLIIGGKKPSYAQLARILGDTEKEFFTLVGELRAADVLSLTEDGTIFCRRMVRDFERSEEGRKWVATRSDRTPTHEDDGSPFRFPNSRPNSRPSSHPNRAPNANQDAKPTTLEARGQKGLKPSKGFKPSGPRESAGVRDAPAPLAGPGLDTVHEIWKSLREEIGEVRWSNTFGNCRPNGSPTTVLCASPYERDTLDTQWTDDLERRFKGRVTFKFDPSQKEATT